MITGLAGNIGSGKSFMQLQYALEQVNFKRKRLVTNFALNIPELKKYCAMKKYGWLAHCLDHRQYAIVDTAEDIDSLLKYPESVVCLDEAGIFLNSRAWQSTSKALLQNLCQSRKDGIDLVWASQFDEQVDKQFRYLTQYWIHCQSLTTYDPTMRRPKMRWKHYDFFDANSYSAWSTSPSARRSQLKTRFQYAFKTVSGALSKSDKQLFNCFDSFSRLERQKDYAVEIQPLNSIPYVLPRTRLKQFQFAKPKVDNLAPIKELILSILE